LSIAIEKLQHKAKAIGELDATIKQLQDRIIDQNDQINCINITPTSVNLTVLSQKKWS